MPQYEYKVVPAPTKGRKAKGVKSPEGRFANAIQSTLNQQGGEGWDYLRAELLPSDERTGLTGSTTNWRNVLVFRRVIAADVAAAPIDAVHEEPAPDLRIEADPQPGEDADQTSQERRAQNLVTVSGMFAAQKSRADAGAEGSHEKVSASDETLAEKT